MPEIITDDKPKKPVQVVLDTENSISTVARGVAIIQVNTVPVGNVVTVYTKTHPDAEWVPHGTYSDNTKSVMVLFPIAYNFVMAARTTGSGNVKVFAQLEK